jgi:ribose transport system permease protein
MTAVAAAPRRPAEAIPADRLFLILSRFAALAVLVVALAILSPHFLTWSNGMNVLRQASVQFLMAAGLTLVVLTGGIDLSVGAVLGLAACLGASFLNGGDIVLGVAAAVAAGLACGAVNGVVVSYIRVPAFIATYGMLWIAHGIGYVFMKGEVIYGFPPAFRAIGAGFTGPIPTTVIVAGLVLATLHLTLHRTVLGRSLYAIGGNATAARLSGMPVQRRVFYAYALSGLLAGFAGLVVIARTNAADAGLGEDLLLPTIAAVCLGGTSLLGGIGGIVGTAAGSLILALVVNGMNLLSVNTYWQAFVMGAIIIVSVLADEWVARRSAGRTGA